MRASDSFETVDFSFKIYGSAANTFWSNTSDVDVCLLIEKELGRSSVNLQMKFRKDTLRNCIRLYKEKVLVMLNLFQQNVFQF